MYRELVLLLYSPESWSPLDPMEALKIMPGARKICIASTDLHLLSRVNLVRPLDSLDITLRGMIQNMIVLPCSPRLLTLMLHLGPPTTCIGQFSSKNVVLDRCNIRGSDPTGIPAFFFEKNLYVSELELPHVETLTLRSTNMVGIDIVAPLLRVLKCETPGRLHSDFVLSFPTLEKYVSDSVRTLIVWVRQIYKRHSINAKMEISSVVIQKRGKEYELGSLTLPPFWESFGIALLFAKVHNTQDRTAKDGSEIPDFVEKALLLGNTLPTLGQWIVFLGLVDHMFQISGPWQRSFLACALLHGKKKIIGTIAEVVIDLYLEEISKDFSKDHPYGCFCPGYPDILDCDWGTIWCNFMIENLNMTLSHQGV